MKNTRRIIPFMLLVTLLYSIVFSSTVFASTGARTDPYSGYTKHSLTLQEYSFSTPQKIELQLAEFIHGDEANSIVAEENRFSSTPASDEEWILLKYHIKYVSGPDEPLYAYDVIYSGSSFYTNNYTAINPISTAYFLGDRSGLDEFDVNMYPGGESDVWYGLLVKKTVGYPVYRVATGYDKSTYSTIYSWFKTDPNYHETSNTRTVTFNSQGGSDVASKTTVYNTLITAPTNPTLKGFTFIGWYREAACTTLWNFAKDKVTANITLFAKWKRNTYTVTFNSEGGTPVASKTAAYNSTITAPTNPTRAAYTFAGWYKQATLTSAWAFLTDKVSANTILYAKWIVAPKFTITVQTNSATYGTVTGGGSYYNDKVKQATVIASPKTGYRFVRWLEGTTPVSTSYKYTFFVTKARTLKAEFAKIGIPAITVASAGYNQIKISWVAVAGSTGYEVYRSPSSNGTYTKVGSITTPYYINTGLTMNALYYYKVRIKCMAGTITTYGSFSACKSTRPIPATPTGVKAVRAGATSIKVTWAAVPGATKYEISRTTSSAGTYVVLTTTANTYYTNSGLMTGRTYYYKVRAYRLVGSTKVYSLCSTVVSAKP